MEQQKPLPKWAKRDSTDAHIENQERKSEKAIKKMKSAYSKEPKHSSGWIK